MARPRRRTVAPVTTPPPLAQPPVGAAPALRSDRRGTRFGDAVAWGAYAQTEGQDINSVFNQIRDANIRGKQGELGFVLSEVASKYGGPEGLNPQLSSWYAAETAAMKRALITAKEQVQKGIEKLKAKGKENYDRRDIIKVYLRYYPRWSDQYARKKKELGQKERYQAKLEVWRAGQEALKEKITVNIYEVETQRGKKKIEAVDEAQALSKAETLYGLKVSTSPGGLRKDIKKVGVQTLTGIEAADRIKTASARGVMDEAEAVKTYGSALGYDIPEDSVPIRLGKSYQFLAKEDAAALRKLPVYAETKGDNADKLTATYEALVSALQTVGPYIKSFVTGIHGQVGAQEQYSLMKATPVEVETARAALAEATARGWSCTTTVEIFKVVLSDGTIMYVEALDSPKKSGKSSVEDKVKAAGYKPAWITKADPTGLVFIDAINVPELVEKKGAVNATEILENAGIPNASATVKDYQELGAYDKEYGTTYAETYRVDGPEAAQEAIDRDAAKIDELENYNTEDGYNLLLARASGVSLETMQQAGFDKDATKWVEESYQTSLSTGVALPGDITYINKNTGEVYGFSEVQALVKDYQDKWATATAAERRALGPNPASVITMTKPTSKRFAIEGVATLFFLPATALLPEVKLRDIRPIEWAVGASQLATLAIPLMPKGMMYTVLGGASAISGYSVRQNWDRLSTPEKVLGVGVTVALAAPVAYSFSKVVSSKLRMAIAKTRGTFRRVLASGPPTKKVSTVLDTATYKLQTLLDEVKGTPYEKQLTPIVNEITDALFTGNARKVRSGGTKLSNLFRSKDVGVTPKGKTIQQLASDGGAFIKTNADDLVRSVEYRVIVDDVINSPTWREARVKLQDFMNLMDDVKIRKERAPTQTLSDYLSGEQYYSTGTTKGQVGPRPEMYQWGKTWQEVTLRQRIYDRLQKLTEAIPWKDRLYRDLQSRISKVRRAAMDDMWAYLEERYGRKWLEEYLQVDKLDDLMRTQQSVNKAFVSNIDDVLDEVKRILRDNKNRPLDSPPPNSLKNLKPPAKSSPTKVSPTKTVTAVKEKVAAIPKTEQLTPQEKAALAAARKKYALEKMTDTQKKALEAARRKIALAKEREASALEAVKQLQQQRLTRAYTRVVTATMPILSEQFIRSLPKGVQPEVVARPFTGTRLAIQAKVGVKPSISVQPLVAPEIAPQVAPQVAPQISPQVSPQVKPQVQPRAWPQPKVVAQPQPVAKSAIATTTKRPFVRLVTVKGEKRYKLPPGSIAWRQGMFWKYIPPPWTQEKPITLKHPPKGALRVGEKTPKKTIQMIGKVKGKGKTKVPKSASIDLGVVDIKISNYGKTISFTGEGLGTVAGGSIADPAKGMSIPATKPAKIKGYTKLAFGTSLRSLTTETYNGDIPDKFAEKALASKLSGMKARAIAKEIKESKVSSERREEILKMLPDRVRKEVELWESMGVEYAPIKRLPKVEKVPVVFRRGSTKPKEITPSTSIG